jgi:capsular exopolysaccharide synthesis family protein
MSKIYEALKKAEREKTALRDQGIPQAPDRVPAPAPAMDTQLPQVAVEEYQKMINTIKLKSTDRNMATILMTSSVHGEGTSSICSQFARALAQAGQEKVLLVDANLRSPVLHDIFGLEREGGFVELMEGVAAEENLAKQTDLPGLFVITSGRPTADPSPLLGLPFLKEVLSRWSRDYSYVLFDSSPVLAYADAAILGRLIDGVVLVVQAGKTRWEVIRRAQDTLKDAQASLLGVVLNRRQYVIPKRLYRRL